MASRGGIIRRNPFAWMFAKLFARRGEPKHRSEEEILGRYAPSGDRYDWRPAGLRDYQVNRTAINQQIRRLNWTYPVFPRIHSVIGTNVIGPGIGVQAQVSHPGGKKDEELNQLIEDGFAAFCDEVDSSGRADFFEMQRQLYRSFVSFGEYLVVMTNLPDRDRFVPLSLMPVDVDRLSGFGARPSKDVGFADGIEYDLQTGRPLAYWISNDWGKATRIEAKYVIHGYSQLEPEQLRGVSPLATAILLAENLSDYMQTEATAAKLLSRLYAFVHTNDPVTHQKIRGNGGADRKTEHWETGTIEYLRPGETIEFANPNRPGSSFEPFIRQIMLQLSAGCDTPYELISGDYTQLSYSSLRGIRLDMLRIIAPAQAHFIRIVCRRVYRAFLEQAVLNGRIPIADFFKSPRAYERAQWIKPGMESVDPLRETKADIDRLANLLISPQEILAAQGRDWEQTLANIAQFRQRARELGLEVQPTSTALAQNPQAILDAQGEGKQWTGDEEWPLQ
jgi:lambda family phage portal protein